MPRGADFDDGVPRSDNAIEPGHNVTHGAGSESTSEGVDRSNKAAPLPEGTSEMKDHHWYSGMGSRGHPESGSGKGGHEPKTLGEQKGLGAKKTSEKADVAPELPSVNRLG
ncbi:hypothetical protein EPUS_07900 [Endocarpon pusillum Z07020]|uniref:Uncharacterized protein n=1 Tax=Endocarpon pusillum (strain Z07020 / HMAS-L-300199) TaxID=1263415 RepID=U1G1U0_ENDPU|nr:uncharacterized protein EPUS_07900 [Endocarpon pusillum Z07020]ERF71217.1 hypothetical protein EPUS_07900 [Endocarpon pusillum Z07020]